LKGRLFITGAQGFTGIHLAQLAKMNQYEVIESQANLLDYEALSNELLACKPDFVIHLAAISSTVSDNQTLLYKTNVIGSLNLLRALNRLSNKPNKVLMISSAHVYGNTGQEIFKEEDSPSPFNHYGVSKLSMELVARQFFNQLPIVIARPFNYTGVGHHEGFVVPKIIKHFKLKLPQIELGNIDTEREYNDVRLICEMYLRLLDSGKNSETYNICTGKVHSIREILSILESLTNQQINIIQNPQLMRTNELKRLCGNPQKLNRIVGDLSRFTLNDTLEWMLHN
jgi:nucleoside-diphosphate-sugar epimerase